MKAYAARGLRPDTAEPRSEFGLNELLDANPTGVTDELRKATKDIQFVWRGIRSHEVRDRARCPPGAREKWHWPLCHTALFDVHVLSWLRFAYVLILHDQS